VFEDECRDEEKNDREEEKNGVKAGFSEGERDDLITKEPERARQTPVFPTRLG